MAEGFDSSYLNPPPSVVQRVGRNVRGVFSNGTDPSYDTQGVFNSNRGPSHEQIKDVQGVFNNYQVPSYKQPKIEHGMFKNSPDSFVHGISNFNSLPLHTETKGMLPKPTVTQQCYDVHKCLPQSYQPELSHKTMRKAKEPNTFDGKSTDWQDYIIHFECVASWNGWTDFEKAQQLIMSLRGSAQKLLGELNVEQLTDYQQIKFFLSRRFSPVEKETAYRCQFRNRKQQRQESASDFGYSLQRICLQAFPHINSEAREIYLIDQFIHGLARQELRSHVQYRHPRTIDTAIALAVEFEAFEGTQGILKKPHFENEEQINSVKSSENVKIQNHASRSESLTLHDIAKMLKELMITVKRSNSSRSRSNSADRRLKYDKHECYKCHKKGHIATNCPSHQEN